MDFGVEQKGDSRKHSTFTEAQGKGNFYQVKLHFVFVLFFMQNGSQFKFLSRGCFLGISSLPFVEDLLL